MKKKIIGIVRYSILTDNSVEQSWAVAKNKSFHELERILFDRERLNQRLFLFKEITLPSVASNLRDWADLRLLVVTSDQLPEWHLAELEYVCSQYDFIEIIKVGTGLGEFGSALSAYIDNNIRNAEEVFLTYRIDDDDALSCDYIDLIAPFLTESYAGMALSLPLGFSGFYDAKKRKMVSYGGTYVAMTALGLGLIANKNTRYRHVFDLKAGSHLMIDRLVPVILLSTQHAYFRTLHDFGSEYHGKGRLASMQRTVGKLQTEVNRDEIAAKISIDEELFLPTSQASKVKILFMMRIYLRLKMKIRNLLQKG